jgi:hypothetical protein
MARRRKPRSPVRRTAAGYVVDLGDEGRDLLIRLLGEMRDLLLGGADSPALRRVFPPAYHLSDDAEAETEYQRLMHDELVASRLAAIDAVTTVLRHDEPIDEAAMLAFVQSVNAMRLVLGTLLDVGEEDELDDIGPDHDLAAEYHLYGYLSYLLGEAVIALSHR